MKREEILEIIRAAAKETHSELSAAVEQQGLATKLFGRDAPLDSLALVALIAAVENRLRDACNDDILLVNEEAMSRHHSPFRSVGALVDYIAELCG